MEEGRECACLPGPQGPPGPAGSNGNITGRFSDDGFFFFFKQPKILFQRKKYQNFSFLGVNVRAKDDSTEFGQEQASVNKQKK